MVSNIYSHCGFQKSDIKRIIAIQSAISNINLQDEKIKNALLRAVQSPNFYKSQEGQKFISGLFGANLDFTKEVHKAFKAILPGTMIHIRTFK